MCLKRLSQQLFPKQTTDERDCPKCSALGWDDAKQVRMERKALIPNTGRVELYQCPECKNVELL